MTDTSTPPSASEERAGSKRLSSLVELWPFLAPYTGMIVATLVALVLTAAVSLTLPLAVRRVVDGFETESVALLDQYFLAALGIAVVLALERACGITS